MSFDLFKYSLVRSFKKFRGIDETCLSSKENECLLEYWSSKFSQVARKPLSAQELSHKKSLKD